MARSHSEFVPRLEANQGFITAQEVRNIRAQLRNMSESKTSVDSHNQQVDPNSSILDIVVFLGH